MASFLAAAPPRSADRDHRLRVLMAAPMPADHLAFMERFGIQELITGFGSTETGAPTIAYSRDPGGIPEGSCGRARPGMQVRLVDEHDVAVDDGEVGEMVVRTDEPWELNVGYLNRPEATVEAWRNGWLHTGDTFRRDGGGHYRFVDRLKDCLRRRGENISSFEVEIAVGTHPDVAEAACVAVPGEFGEDEVKVFVVPEPGHRPDFPDLVGFLGPRLAHYAIPRYYELIEALPKTVTARVKKYELRERGNCAGTWDRRSCGSADGD
jgi:crotonobetaine/carnitine-CoA ligase